MAASRPFASKLAPTRVIARHPDECPPSVRLLASQHEEALRRTEEYLKKAIDLASLLPDPIEERHQTMQSDALLDMRIAMAFVIAALTAKTDAVPI